MKNAPRVLLIALVLLATAAVTALHAAPPPARGPEQRLGGIRLANVQFRQAALPDVLDYLGQESRRADPQGRGANLVLVDPPESPPRITLHLRNIPVLEAIRYVAQAAGLRVRVEPHAVVLHRSDAPAEPMIVRSYSVEAGAFKQVITERAAGGEW